MSVSPGPSIFSSISASSAGSGASDFSRSICRLLPDSPSQASPLADATVLCGRLHGLERLEPRQTPQETMELLSTWCTLMFDVITSQSGEVAQFSGDGLLALFAEPQAALRAGLEVTEMLAQFNSERATVGQAPVGHGVGIARGSVLAGTASTSRRVAYVCLGEPVLIAERLAAAYSSGGHPLLMDGPVRVGLDAASRTATVSVSVSVPADGEAFTMAFVR